MDYQSIPGYGSFFEDVAYNNCTPFLLFYVLEEGTSLMGIDAIGHSVWIIVAGYYNA